MIGVTARFIFDLTTLDAMLRDSRDTSRPGALCMRLSVCFHDTGHWYLDQRASHR